tara:strand:+ start:155 stop:451 length:297 start_codon:yes stop_codon:yes gene_type:complete
MKDFLDYANSVAEEFHVTMDSIFEKNKRPMFVEARQMLYLLCREKPIRISYIQHYLKEQGYDVSHTTIMYNYEKAKTKVSKDKSFKDIFNKLKKKHVE